MCLENLLYFVFPKVCGICGRKIYENATYTCEKCTNIIKYSMKIGFCKKSENKNIEKIFSLFLYEGIIRNKILKFKFENKPYLGKMFAKLMSDFVKNHQTFELIIPVPIHRKRYFERGYNQSKILAQNISKNLKVKMLTNVLIKAKNTTPQSTLNLKQRSKNVIGIYKIKKNEKIIGKKILLVDDVYTTGATVGECAKILKESGAKTVSVLTIAYSKFSKEDF